LGYVAAQILGATAASGILWSLATGIPGYGLAEHGLGANGNPQGLSLSTLVGLETLMTALFVFVIFAATRPGSSHVGAALAIGGFLFLAHLVGVPLGDSSLNPARSIGPAIFVRGEALSVLWVFVVGPVAGGVIGWLGYRATFGEQAVRDG
jgi:aquaporin Z